MIKICFGLNYLKSLLRNQIDPEATPEHNQ